MRKLFKFISPLLNVFFIAIIISQVAAQNASNEVTYASEKRCKVCHIDRHKSWRANRHSKTFDTLNEEQQKNPLCLKCHTTGFGEGGFVSVDETPTLKGVQCEQCHGTGSKHIPLMSKLKKDKVDRKDFPEDLMINKRPTTCIKCHSPHEVHMPIE